MLKIDMTFMIREDEAYIIFAALTSMVLDVHSVQDCLSKEQWATAEKVFNKLSKHFDSKGKSK